MLPGCSVNSANTATYCTSGEPAYQAIRDLFKGILKGYLTSDASLDDVSLNKIVVCYEDEITNYKDIPYLYRTIKSYFS